jgi:hypothetical protein
MVDTKDWTWVLEQRCPDCGFDAGELERNQIGSATRRVAERFEGFLERDGARERPASEVWSVLEYGCHLRDVGRIFGERLALMLDEDGPQFANWDQDDTAIVDRYDLQDPAVVAVELATSLGALADAYDAVRPDQWDRRGFRSNGSIFTVESLGRYMVHDLVHHAWDIDPSDPVDPA